MNLAAILSNIGIADILDILLISIIAYQFYSWFWGTQAFRALLGIVVLSGIYIIANAWGLFLTTWAFQVLWQVFVILLIILFQKEIRQVLIRFNPLKTVGLKSRSHPDEWYELISSWAFDAAAKKTGAVIVFERNDLVFDLITKGIAVESDPRPEILWSIFSKASPMHDGAVVISQGKLLKASCFLPLTLREDLPGDWGTRHRAALGITEQCDAVALTISEERGQVSLIVGDSYEEMRDEAHLNARLKQNFDEGKVAEDGLMTHVRSWFTHRWHIKGALFVLVFVLWLALAGQQNYERKMTIPVNFINLPAGLMIRENQDQAVTITCRGLRKDVSLLNRDNVSSSVSLSAASPGVFPYYLTAANIKLPNNRIHLIQISQPKGEVLITETP